MITNDKGIVELKHFILREICRLAWNGQLTAEEVEKILYQVSPGPKPQYRCCIYKEREIVRGRIRLALGQSPEPAQPTRNVVAGFPPPATTARSRTISSRTSAASAWAKHASVPASSTPSRRAMVCPGGCVGGPSKHQAETLVLKARSNLLAKADGRKILDNLKNYPMDQFSMYRDGSMPGEENIPPAD